MIRGGLVIIFEGLILHMVMEGGKGIELDGVQGSMLGTVWFYWMEWREGRNGHMAWDNS